MDKLQEYEFKVFETGDFGELGKFSEADLDDMATLYDPVKIHNAPVVLGHPKTDSPAFGWADSLRRVGTDLMAKVKLLPEMIDWIKRGFYSTRSTAIYRDPNGPGKGKAYLKHIGFLGGTPPVIKGMPPVAIEMGESGGKFVVFEFSDDVTADHGFKLQEIASVMQNLREWLIEQFDIVTADKVIGKWSLDALRRVATESESIPAFAEKIKREVMKNMINEVNFSEAQVQDRLAVELTKQKTALTTEFAEKLTSKDAEITTLKAENETLKGKVTEFSEKAQKVEVDNFVDGLLRSGKLIPALKDKVSASLLKLAKTDPVLFAEQKDIYSNGSKIVEFSEIPGADGAPVQIGELETMVGKEAATKFAGVESFSFGRK